VSDIRRQTEDVIACIEGTLPADTVRERQIRIEELRSRHVMGRQRTTHAASTGEQAAADDEPLIELF
jgi:methyl-accepting chemotaxis protein